MKDAMAEWLHKQHSWLQEAAHRILTKGKLSPADFADLAQHLKKSEPKANPPRTYPSIGNGTTSPSGLRLISIGPIEGIDALNPRLPLEFGTGNFTVIYGTNGSGKSGYTRIITKACGKPHSVDLKSNVYEDFPTKRECTFQFQIDGINKTVNWRADSEPIRELDAVEVFDTNNGRIYLERETELSYEPPELAFFIDMVETCKRVEAELKREEEKLTSQLPELFSAFGNTKAATAYKSLSHDIDKSKLDDLLSWTTANEA